MSIDLNHLKHLDPARDREPSEAEWTRSRHQVERIIEGRAVSEPKRALGTVRRRVLAGVVAAAAATVGVIAVPALFPSSAERAIASWTPAPGSLTGADVLPQARACAESGVGGLNADAVRPEDVILAEQRGAATLLIMRQGDSAVQCLICPDDERMMAGGMVAEYQDPGARVITLDTSGAWGEGKSQFSYAIGFVDRSVTAVDVVLRDGETLTATVKSGWWAAWWPGPEGGEVGAYTVDVHTAAGTRTFTDSELMN